jgi:hypothetical protein
MEINQYRSRIGLFAIGNFRSANSEKMVLYVSKFSVMSDMASSLGLNYVTVIFVLLLIGGIELNPGPPKSGKTIEDIFAKLESFEIILSDIAAIKNTVTEINANVTHMEQQLKTLKATCHKLKAEKLCLEERLDRIEGFSRRTNLVFFNVSEDKGEKQTEEIVIDVVKNHMDIELYSNEIESAHRIGRRIDGTRPILVKFNNFKRKIEILKASRLLNGTKIGISEDYSKAVRTVRSKLRPYMLLARERGDYAILRDDKLIVNGRRYSLEEVEARSTPEAEHGEGGNQQSQRHFSQERTRNRPGNSRKEIGQDAPPSTQRNVGDNREGTCEEDVSRNTGGLLAWLDRGPRTRRRHRSNNPHRSRIPSA